MSRIVPSPTDIGRTFDEGAEGYDARHAASQGSLARFRIVEAPLRAIARGGGHVLDLGCGTGRVLEDRAAGAIGLDASRGLLAQAARRGIRAVLADAHAMPFADARFDAVVAGGAVFAHLDYARALRECARVLCRGGRLAFNTFAADPWSPWTVLGRRPPPDSRFLGSFDEIRVPARAAGFVEESLRLWRGIRFAPWVIPIPERFAWRLWNHATFVLRKTG